MDAEPSAATPDASQHGDSLGALAGEIVECRRCPRLVAWRELAAETKRPAYRDETYWGRPLTGFGDPDAKVLLVGLAPAAHGGNRTGRIFTGDRSGDWLFAALWRAGFANQPASRSIDDGLELIGAYVTAAVRCAPPANRPTTTERDACAPFLRRELALLRRAHVFVALGGFAHDAIARELGLRPRPTFRHGATWPVTGQRTLLDCYHPSQQNTFTGRLTEPMLDEVFHRARVLAEAGSTRAPDSSSGTNRG